MIRTLYELPDIRLIKENENQNFAFMWNSYPNIFWIFIINCNDVAKSYSLGMLTN
ncbi:MAG: hypothetical protein HW410_937 [Nitrosarchaeum sp.]|nr:hypothetical protein [Nitrosarchaeum sp.]